MARVKKKSSKRSAGKKGKVSKSKTKGKTSSSARSKSKDKRKSRKAARSQKNSRGAKKPKSGSKSKSSRFVRSSADLSTVKRAKTVTEGKARSPPRPSQRSKTDAKSGGRKLSKVESGMEKEAPAEAGPSGAKKKTRKRVTPGYGRTRGPHPKSPPAARMMEVANDLPRHGYIARNPTGLIFLDLDDAWVFTPLEELEGYGYEAPPYFYPPLATGAHITVVPTQIAEQFQVNENKVNIGEKVKFEVTRGQVVYPNRYWYGTEAVYQYRIKSAELTRMRNSLVRNKWKRVPPLNITVAIRRLQGTRPNKPGKKS